MVYTVDDPTSGCLRLWKRKTGAAERTYPMEPLIGWHLNQEEAAQDENMPSDNLTVFGGVFTPPNNPAKSDDFLKHPDPI